LAFFIAIALTQTHSSVQVWDTVVSEGFKGGFLLLIVLTFGWYIESAWRLYRSLDRKKDILFFILVLLCLFVTTMTFKNEVSPHDLSLFDRDDFFSSIEYILDIATSISHFAVVIILTSLYQKAKGTDERFTSFIKDFFMLWLIYLSAYWLDEKIEKLYTTPANI